MKTGDIVMVKLSDRPVYFRSKENEVCTFYGTEFNWESLTITDTHLDHHKEYVYYRGNRPEDGWLASFDRYTRYLKGKANDEKLTTFMNQNSIDGIISFSEKDTI